MQTKDLNIILLNYSMTEYPSGNSIDINESDTFRIYIDGKEQIDGADNGIGDNIKILVVINTASNVASIQVQKTIDFGIVTLTVTPFGTSDIYTATIDGTNILQSNPIPDVSDSYGTQFLYGTDTINPEFTFVPILGCNINQVGPFPDKYGRCRDNQDPNPFGYCKVGYGFDTVYGYSVCNFDPDANTEDGCVYNANGVIGTPSSPFNAVQDTTYCDCFGHTLDCAGQCISDHAVGVCDPAYIGTAYNDGNNFATEGNGTGCHILTCKGQLALEADPNAVLSSTDECISADSWMTYYNDNAPDGDGTCEGEVADMYYCESVPQGEGHPLVGTDYVDVTGKATFGCSFDDCYDCTGPGVCVTNEYWSTTFGMICEECIGSTSTADVYPCQPPWNDLDPSNWLCRDGWSQDCQGRCPPSAGDYTPSENYFGPCYVPSIINYGDGEESPQLIALYSPEEWPEGGICGIGCDGVCGSGQEYDECGICGGDGIPNGACGCAGTHGAPDGEFPVFDCQEPPVCGGPAVMEECGCDTPLPVWACGCAGTYGAASDEYPILDCAGSCNGNSVDDDCGNCCHEDSLTIITMDDSSGSPVYTDTGTSCKFFTTQAWTTQEDITTYRCEQYSSNTCLINNTYCDCTENIFDCRAINAYLLPAAEEAIELENSCGGGQSLDDCGVCNGNNSSCEDCCGVPNGNGDTCDGECGPCNDDTSCLDICGVPNGNGYGLTDFPEIRYQPEEGDEIIVEQRLGVPNCDCDQNPQRLWCVDSNQNGIGCYDCGGGPQYSCENPGGLENSDLFVEVVGYADGMAEYCSESFLDEDCAGTYDHCMVCDGNRNNIICSGGTNDSLSDPYCCGGENYCDCNDSCWPYAPSELEGYNSDGSINETNGFYDCAGNCHGSAYIDECGNCCFEGTVYVDALSTNQACGPQLGACDCNGNVYDCRYGNSDYLQEEENLIEYCGGDYVNDHCGICGGDCEPFVDDGTWVQCDEQNSCGTCYSNFEPVTCNPENPIETFNQVCNCEGDSVCDDCGLCGGNGKGGYYNDIDGDGIVCSDHITYFCPEIDDSFLSELCGIGDGSPCWYEVDTYAGTTESGLNCD